MMRWKWIVVPALLALALPMTVNASGLRRGCSGCNTGKCGVGGGFLGGLHNHPCTNCGAGGQGSGGLGFFQPPFQAAPWYLYWPYEAHFQLPAPIGGPFFAPQHLSNPAMNPYFSGHMGGATPPPAPPIAPAPAK